MDAAFDARGIDAALVRRLIAAQFPAWAGLSVRPVVNGGHDNRTFRLGDTMSVRLPSDARYAASVETEHTWLPKLARLLPLPIPVPLGLGEPCPLFPWHWSVNRWLVGEDASHGRIDDVVQFAVDLAGFLNVLESLDATFAPGPGKETFFRGGDLRVYDDQTRRCIEALHDLVDRTAATAVWEAALEAGWQGPDVWVHGDIAASNLLVDEGRLCGVIDFGQMNAGDPACDTTIAWTLLSGASRQAFRDTLQVDESTWARGRGWGLWKALLVLRECRATEAASAARAQRQIADILAG